MVREQLNDGSEVRKMDAAMIFVWRPRQEGLNVRDTFSCLTGSSMHFISAIVFLLAMYCFNRDGTGVKFGNPPSLSRLDASRTSRSSLSQGCWLVREVWSWHVLIDGLIILRIIVSGSAGAQSVLKILHEDGGLSYDIQAQTETRVWDNKVHIAGAIQFRYSNLQHQQLLLHWRNISSLSKYSRNALKGFRNAYVGNPFDDYTDHLPSPSRNKRSYQTGSVKRPEGATSCEEVQSDCELCGSFVQKSRDRSSGGCP